MTWVAVLLLAAFAENPPQLEARIRSGMAALERNDLAKAEAEFAEAARVSPSNGGAWLLLAQTRAKQGKQDTALAAALKAEAVAGNDGQLLQGLANFYAVLAPDYPKAARIGAKYAGSNTNDPLAWRRLTDFCLRTGQPDAAIAAATRGLSVDDSSELHRLLAKAYAQRKAWPHAIEEFTRVLQLQPFDEQAHFELAQAHLQRQDFQSAISVLENARKTFDKSPQLELALGVAYYGLREFPLAVTQFLRTIQLDPDVPQPYVFLGRMIEHLGDRMPDAFARFTAYEQRHPESYLGHLLHAQVLVAQLPPSGFPPEAEAALTLAQQAIKLNETSAEAHYYAGLLLDRKRDFAGAATQLERSIQLNSKDSAAHFRLALVYSRLGRQDEAAKERDLHEKLSEQEKAPAPPPAREP